MADDVIRALCALVALFIPLGFAWWVVSRTARRHHHRDRFKDRPMR